ncbi:MAG: adenosylcobinamide-phosphate synthase CbiB [Pseudomonadota bacterium]
MTFLFTNLIIAVLALIIERIIGYPNWLYTIIRHPIVWMGALISLCEKYLNNPAWSPDIRKLTGASSLLILLFIVALISSVLAGMMREWQFGPIFEAMLASTMLAQKSLGSYVKAVAKALETSVEDGRQAVAHIVGRDPTEMDESEVSKAAIESLAENTSDGVVAPLFWLALLGLPGIALYKAINTADSMIGHKSDRYKAYGSSSAQLDDAANYLPARLTGLIFVIAAYITPKCAARGAFTAMSRDAHRHVSPNAGWPEAAMAGALKVTLGGERSYQGQAVRLATMGDGRRELASNDIHRALKLYGRALSVTLVLLVLYALAFGSVFL